MNAAQQMLIDANGLEDRVQAAFGEEPTDTMLTPAFNLIVGNQMNTITTGTVEELLVMQRKLLDSHIDLSDIAIMVPGGVSTKQTQANLNVSRMSTLYAKNILGI